METLNRLNPFKVLTILVLFFLLGCSKSKDDKPAVTPNDNAFIAGNWKLQKHITHNNLNGNVSDVDDTNSLFILIPCLKSTTFVFQSDGVFKFSDSCDWTNAGFYTNEPFTLTTDHLNLLMTDTDKSINKFKVEFSGNTVVITDGDDIHASKTTLVKI